MDKRLKLKHCFCSYPSCNVKATTISVWLYFAKNKTLIWCQINQSVSNYGLINKSKQTINLVIVSRILILRPRPIFKMRV